VAPAFFGIHPMDVVVGGQGAAGPPGGHDGPVARSDEQVIIRVNMRARLPAADASSQALSASRDGGSAVIGAARMSQNTSRKQGKNHKSQKKQ